MFNPKEHLSKVKGKDYLEVKWRLVWFRDSHPEGSINTEFALHDPIVIKASVFTKDELLLGTGMGTPKTQGVAASRPFEGAETAAIGRALAVAGFGTQFTGEELSEGEHLADSPVEEAQTYHHDVIIAIVAARHAENDFSAKGMLAHSNLPVTVGSQVATSWAKYYRASRDEGKKVDEAANIANKKYSDSIGAK